MSLRGPLKTLDLLGQDATKTLQTQREQRQKAANLPLLVSLGDVHRAGSDAAVIRVDQREAQGSALG
eukprot:7218162-Alexandrium_andersonii.AAC.1